MAICEKEYAAPHEEKDQAPEQLDQCYQGSFEILENGISKFRISDPRITFYAICRARDGLTTFLVNRWNGSATTNGPIISIKFDPNTNRLKETMVLSQGYIEDSEQEDMFVNCRAGQNSFNLKDSSFPLCNCTFEQAASIRSLTNELFSEKIFGKFDGIDTEEAEPYLDIAYEELPIEKFCSGKEIQLNEIENYNPNLRIFSKDLQAFISAIKNIGPQLAEDHDETYGKTNLNPFFLSKLKGENIVLTSIVYSEASESWSVALMKPYDSGTWKIFHATKFGYKVLQPIELIKRLGGINS